MARFGNFETRDRIHNHADSDLALESGTLSYYQLTNRQFMSSSTKMPARWVYIAGRGHSGSTVVDAMLGNADEIESVGELVSGMGRMDGLCACGASFRDCDYWNSIRQRFESSSGRNWDEAVSMVTGQASVRFFLRTALASRDSHWVNDLTRMSGHLAATIAGDKQIVVDSSKEISRALFLLRFAPNSRVIHLVRHPDRILASNYFRLKAGSGFRFMRRTLKSRRWTPVYLCLTSAGWLVGNTFARIVRSFAPDRFHTLRYEDLVQHPDRELDSLESFLAVSLQTMRDKIRDETHFQVGHNIGGNHMRMQGKFHFDTRKTSNRELPTRYKVISRLICWPMMLVYRYR